MHDTSFRLWRDGQAACFSRVLVLSQRSKLWPPRSSSGKRGLGQGLKPQLVRSGSSANPKLRLRLLNHRIAKMHLTTACGASRVDSFRAVVSDVAPFIEPLTCSLKKAPEIGGEF